MDMVRDYLLNCKGQTMHLLTELGLVGRENTWLEVMEYREPNFSQSISVYHNTFVVLILIKKFS